MIGKLRTEMQRAHPPKNDSCTNQEECARGERYGQKDRSTRSWVDRALTCVRRRLTMWHPSEDIEVRVMRWRLGAGARAVTAVVIMGFLVSCATEPAPFPERRSDGGHGMVTPYTLTMRGFTDREAFTILAAMAEEFPGYRSHDLIRRSGSVRTYAYVTTAKSYKLEEWLYIQLRNMGFDPDRDISFRGQGVRITIEKLVPSPSREAPAERPRFR